MSPPGPPIVRLFDGARQRVGVPIAVPLRLQCRARAARGAAARSHGRHPLQSRTVRSWRRARAGCSVAVRRRVSAARPPGQHHPQR
jgi:hypothetical protein